MSHPLHLLGSEFSLFFASLHYPDLSLPLHSLGSKVPLLFTFLHYSDLLCTLHSLECGCPFLACPLPFTDFNPLLLSACECLLLTHFLLHPDLHLFKLFRGWVTLSYSLFLYPDLFFPLHPLGCECPLVTFFFLSLPWPVLPFVVF
jgi:hypothetical protein